MEEKESTNITGQKRDSREIEQESKDSDTELELNKKSDLDTEFLFDTVKVSNEQESNKKSVRTEPYEGNRAIFRTGTLSGELGIDSHPTKYMNALNRIKNSEFVSGGFLFKIKNEEFNTNRKEIITNLLKDNPLLIDNGIQRIIQEQPYTWVLFTSGTETEGFTDHLIMNNVLSPQEFGTTHEELIARFSEEFGLGPPHRIYLTGECVLTDKGFIFNLASGSFMMNKLKKYTKEDIIEIKQNMSTIFRKFLPEYNIFFTDGDVFGSDTQTFIRQVKPISDEAFEAFKAAGVPFEEVKKSSAKPLDYKNYIDKIPVSLSVELAKLKPLTSRSESKAGGTRKKQRRYVKKTKKTTT